MASEKLEQIIGQIDELTVLELSELVKALEEKYDVSASAPMAMAAMPAAGGGAPEAEEQTEFDAILVSSGGSKIQVIKEVRAITNLGLKEAKGLVDAAPKAIKEAVSKEEAEEIKSKIEAVGGTVEVK